MDGILAQQTEQQANPQAPAVDVASVPPGAEAQANEMTMKAQKALLAAKHLMYDDKYKADFFHDMKEFQKSMPPVQAAAEEAANLIFVLFAASHQTLDPRVIVPAGVLIVGEIMDFLEKVNKTKFSDKDHTDSLKLFIEAIKNKQQEAAAQGSPQPAAQPNGGGNGV